MASTSSSLLRRQVIQRLPASAYQTLRPLSGISEYQSLHNACRHQVRLVASHYSPSLEKSPRRRLAVASKGAQHRGLRPAAPTAFYPVPMRQFSSVQSAENTATPDASFQPIIHDVFEEKTGTWQYVVADPNTLTATIIDSVLDYDPLARTISTHSADKILLLIKRMGYRVDSILETHIHADHLTAARYLQTSLHKEQGYLPLITVGKRIVHIQELFRQKYGLSEEETRGVFDRFLDDDERFHIGALEAQAIHLPGHTPDHMGFKIGGRRPHLLL